MFSDIDKLRKISFNSLGVKFANGEDYSFNKKDFNLDFNVLSKNTMASHLEMRIGRKLLEELVNTASIFPLETIEKKKFFRM